MEDTTFTPKQRTTLFRAMTGRSGDTAPTASPTDLLLAAFGSTPQGGVDTRAAASALEVSQRTVQRWIAREGRQRTRPRADHLKALQSAARQAASTARGRRSAMSARRGDARDRLGAKITVTGRQGVRGPERWYMRLRTTVLQLDADQVQDLRNAYERGGDRALVTWLEGHYDEAYTGGWGFEGIDKLDLDRP